MVDGWDEEHESGTYGVDHKQAETRLPRRTCVRACLLANMLNGGLRVLTDRAPFSAPPTTVWHVNYRPQSDTEYVTNICVTRAEKHVCRKWTRELVSEVRLKSLFPKPKPNLPLHGHHMCGECWLVSLLPPHSFMTFYTGRDHINPRSQQRKFHALFYTR